MPLRLLPRTHPARLWAAPLPLPPRSTVVVMSATRGHNDVIAFIEIEVYGLMYRPLQGG